jgi:hypothetical protein
MSNVPALPEDDRTSSRRLAFIGPQAPTWARACGSNGDGHGHGGLGLRRACGAHVGPTKTDMGRRSNGAALRASTGIVGGAAPGLCPVHGEGDGQPRSSPASGPPFLFVLRNCAGQRAAFCILLGKFVRAAFL